MALQKNFPTFGKFFIYNAMKKNLSKITSWDLAQRPREKFLQKGPQALSTEELIAIIISSGTPEKNAVELSREILDAASNDLSRLSRFTEEDFRGFPGIGTGKAVKLMAVFEISRRYQMQSALPLPQIYSSAAAAQTISPMLKDLTHEECWIMYLNRGNRLIAQEKLSSGGLGSTVMDTKMILKKAMGKLASSIILVHNHPSGNRTPGKEDIIQTQRLKEAAKACDICLMDHLIIAGNSYFSFSDDGAL